MTATTVALIPAVFPTWRALSPWRHRLAAAAAAIALLLAPAVQALEAGPSRADLVAIFQATRALQVPDDLAGIPDYTDAAIQRSRQALARLRQQFDALDP